VTIHGGQRFNLNVAVRNPDVEPVNALVRLSAPQGWEVQPGELPIQPAPQSWATAMLQVTPPVGRSVRRARLGVDLTLGSRRLGQQAEVLVTVLNVQH
jgi:hypothetical protein